MDSYDILPLRVLIESSSDDATQSKLSSFKCSRDLEREEYLHSYATMFEKRGMSRTYLAVSKSSEILGYYSIGMKCLKVEEDAEISGSLRKKMNVNAETGVAQSYLLGQLGRSDNSPRGLGKAMLADALAMFREANLLVGCRMVRLDCSKDLAPYYKALGFVNVGRNKARDLDQMVLIF